MLRLTLLAFLVGCSSKIMGTMPVDTGEAEVDAESEDTDGGEGDDGTTGGSSSGGSTGPSTTGGSSSGGSSTGGSSTGGSSSGGSTTDGSSSGGSGSGSFELGPPPGEGGTPEPGLVCRDGSFFDCNLECLPIDPFLYWLGDAYCDEMIGADLNCEAFEYDLGDCEDPTASEDDGDGTGGETTDGGTTGDGTAGGETSGDETGGDDTTDGGSTDDSEPEPVIGEACAEGRVYDCSLTCVFEEFAIDWIGDDYCEDGTAYDGAYNLYCEEFDFDGGDCDDDPTGGGTTGGETTGGETTGGETTGGDEAPEGTDPGAPCGAGRIYDCAEKCGTGTLLWEFSVDDFCDDGTTWTFDLTCEYFDYDNGECDAE